MEKSPYSGRERRRFRRISRHFVARALPQGADPVNGWNTVFIRNISKGGVLFSSDREYKEGSLLKLSISLLDNPRQVECSALVIRNLPSTESQMNDISGQFKEVEPWDARLIEKFIEEYIHKLGELGIRPD